MCVAFMYFSKGMEDVVIMIGFVRALINSATRGETESFQDYKRSRLGKEVKNEDLILAGILRIGITLLLPLDGCLPMVFFFRRLP